MHCHIPSFLSLTSFFSEDVPPLCTHIIGFESRALIPWMVVTETQSLLQNIVSYGTDIWDAIVSCYGPQNFLMSATSILLGTRAAIDQNTQANPEWRMLATAPLMVMWGLPTPQCPCGDTPTVRQQPRGGKTTRRFACPTCPKRSAYYFPPSQSSVPLFPNLRVWNWPLKVQDWHWAESGDSAEQLELLY